MKKKDFDCVQMKHDIQQKILKETEGMSQQEVNAYTVKKIESNPILAKVWQRTRRTAVRPIIKKPLPLNQ